MHCRAVAEVVPHAHMMPQQRSLALTPSSRRMQQLQQADGMALPRQDTRDRHNCLPAATGRQHVHLLVLAAAAPEHVSACSLPGCRLPLLLVPQYWLLLLAPPCSPDWQCRPD
jgi:hypothetical protein